MQPIVGFELLPAIVQSPWFKHYEEYDDEAQQYEPQRDIDLHGETRKSFGEGGRYMVDDHFKEAKKECTEEYSGGATPAAYYEHPHEPY